MNVTYIDHMGTDRTVVQAARVSLNNIANEVLDAKDVKLIKYLAEHRHTSTFEHCSMTVLVECPLFIAAQWMRHRTFAYNQVSRRYTSDSVSFWNPKTWRKQSASNRQASTGILSGIKQLEAAEILEDALDSAFQAYIALLDLGVCREQARAVLPQGMMTKFYATANLHNWAHFIRLRDHDGAQKEIQELAQSCKLLLAERFPISVAALLP